MVYITDKVKAGDIITFRVASNKLEYLKGTVDYIEQLGFITVVDGVQYELRKLLDIQIHSRALDDYSNLHEVVNTLSAQFNKETSLLVIKRGEEVLLTDKDIEQPEDYWTAITIDGVPFDLNLYNPEKNEWTLWMYALEPNGEGGLQLNTNIEGAINLEILN
jgi:hypothetical protein